MGTDLVIYPTDVYIVDRNNQKYMRLTDLTRCDLSIEQYQTESIVTRYYADIDAGVCRLHVIGDTCRTDDIYNAGINDEEFEDILFGGDVVG